MDYEYQIEVPIKNGVAQDVRGSRFENVVRRYIANQSYVVKDRYRHAGSEVDILAENRLTGNVACVECKARKENVNSSDVSTLFANLFQMDANLGLLFYISKLGKETQSKADQLEKNSSKKIRFFGPKELIDFLLSSRQAVLPPLDSDSAFSRDIYFLILDDREIWVRTQVNRNGERIANLALSITNGLPLELEECPDLSETDWSLASLPWANGKKKEKTSSNQIPRTSQTVARVNSSDRWLDFLPSNPRDFVGRQDVVSEFSEYLDELIINPDTVRTVGIKGSSGWGKSSFCLKVSETSKYKARCPAYILPVDCRAAIDFNFADLAFKRLIDDAVRDQFILPIFRASHAADENPFITGGYPALFSELKASGRSIGIIFDQFEEIIHVDQYAALFQRLKLLSLLIDDLKVPMFMGFSWKTDGSVGTDNAGYQMWHSLADRRRDFVIRPFNRKDSEEFIRKAVSSENKRISNRNIEILIEQGNGYPWLLKKLSVRLIKSSTATFLNPTISEFDIRQILEEDLESLSERERSALKYIAEKAPIDSYIVAEKYGEDALTNLINRRLTVRTGNKIAIYWDIFREYILSNRIPAIPTTYVHSMSTRKLVSSIRQISQKRTLTYTQFANIMSVSERTADNIIRDLWHMDLLVPHRMETFFDVKIKSQDEGLQLVEQFLSRHVIFQIFTNHAATKSFVKFEDIRSEIFERYSFINPSENTLHHYFKRIMTLAEMLQKVKRRGSGYIPNTSTNNQIDPSYESRPRETELFRAHAPPTKVLELGKLLLSGPILFSEIRAAKLRNSVYALNTLGLSYFDKDKIILSTHYGNLNELEFDLRKKAAKQDSIIETRRIIEQFPSIGGKELAQELSNVLELNWSPKSCMRYGPALRAWVNWLYFA